MHAKTDPDDYPRHEPPDIVCHVLKKTSVPSDTRPGRNPRNAKRRSVNAPSRHAGEPAAHQRMRGGTDHNDSLAHTSTSSRAQGKCSRGDTPDTAATYTCSPTHRRNPGTHPSPSHGGTPRSRRGTAGSGTHDCCSPSSTHAATGPSHDASRPADRRGDATTDSGGCTSRTHNGFPCSQQSNIPDSQKRV